MELCYTNNPNSLFRKYAKLVTYLTRHQIGRDYLGIPHKDIGLLLPNGYHRVQDDVTEATFFTRAVYAPKLYPALQRIDAVQHYIVGIDEALKTLTYQLGLTRNYGFAPDVSLATYVPDAHPETTTVDGKVGRGAAGQSWATIHDSTGNDVADNGASGECAQLTGEGGSTWTYLFRSIFLYDTSSLGAGASITSASHGVYGSGSGTGLGDNAIYLVTATTASNTALANGDYDVAGFGTTDLHATGLNVSDWSAAGYNTKALNATGIAAISKTGITKFGMRLQWDAANSAPSNSAATTNANGYFADNGSNKPTLTIVVAGGAKIINFL